MTSKKKEELINELKKSGNIIFVLDKVKNKLSFIEMLELAGNLSDKKKEIVYDYALNNYNVSVDDVSLIFKNDVDMALFIHRLVNKKDILSALRALKYIHDESIISNLLNEIINTIMVNRMPKNDFEDEILNIIQNYEGYIGNDVLGNYLKYDYSIEKLENIISILKEDIVKQIYYSHLINDFGKNISYKKSSDSEKSIMIDACLGAGKYNFAFKIMKSMDNPKLLEKDKIKKILADKDSLTIYKFFNTLFIDEILDRKDYYNLIKYSDELPNDVIKKIYIKSFSSVRDYSYIIYMLSKDKRKEYTKVFLEKKCDNASIANHILKNKDYEKEDYERLLLIVVMFAKVDVIYDVLMRENLSDNQRKALEKALLDTHDIEYIAYYYFFKDIEKFNLLFGSSLLFLSYVTLNKDKFKNKNILSKIKEKIKEENNNELSSKIEGNINTYIKKRKV